MFSNEPAWGVWGGGLGWRVEAGGPGALWEALARLETGGEAGARAAAVGTGGRGEEDMGAKAWA